jgi:hypothetical protein
MNALWRWIESLVRWRERVRYWQQREQEEDAWEAGLRARSRTNGHRPR